MPKLDHDKHCETLYGMLPLAVGLPVMLVDHLDRNPDKQLLRGREKHNCSWVHDPDVKKQVMPIQTPGS